MRQDNLSVFQDTIAILNQGWYEKNGQRIALKLKKDEMEEAIVFLPKDKPLFLYCLRGTRSKRAAMILKRMGYQEVRSIGGIRGYKGDLESLRQA